LPGPTTIWSERRPFPGPLNLETRMDAMLLPDLGAALQWQERTDLQPGDRKIPDGDDVSVAPLLDADFVGWRYAAVLTP